MREMLCGMLVGGGLLVLLYYWARLAGRRRRALERLGQAETPEPEGEREPLPPGRSYTQRWRWAAGVVALAVGLVLHYVVQWAMPYTLAFAGISGFLVWRLEAWQAERQQLLIQIQLANALDLLISTLRAGASLLAALEVAAREARAPLKPQLENALGRIRYGDDPEAVIRGLETRVPLETFRLFCESIAVHWEVGGSLAPALATVARAIRERVELARRVRSLSTQARVSVVIVLLVTYFIAAVSWRSDPRRMADFLNTTVGQTMALGGIVLQAVGVVWTSWMSRVRS
jgi:Flp pilus assembly protein TadB